MTDDQHILKQIRDGNSLGLQVLFNKYYQLLVRSAFYITQNREVAEDLTQEVFIKIWETGSAMTTVGNVKAYLNRMITNRALDHMQKHRSTRQKLEQFLYFQDEIAEFPDQKADDLKKEIASALATLPPRCRLIFSLNRLEGLTNDEIADYLEISKRTVETQISKALKLLRGELKHLWNQYLLSLLF